MSKLNLLKLNNKNKIALFCSDNIIACLILNKLVPCLIEIDINPVIFITTGKKINKEVVIDLEDYNFYESTLLKGSVQPLLKSEDQQYFGPNTDLVTLAKLYGIDIAYVENPNDKTFISKINADSEYLGAVSIRNYRIFSAELISAFMEKGFIWNLHMGDLPKYRGVYAPFHALMNGEEVFAWTLHEMIAGIDEGRIIDKVSTPLKKTRPIFSTYIELVADGANMIFSYVSQYKKERNVPTVAQVEADASYFSFPKADEIRRAKDGDIKLIDHPSTIINLYLSFFSKENTSLRDRLRTDMIQKVSQYEQSKEVNEDSRSDYFSSSSKAITGNGK